MKKWEMIAAVTCLGAAMLITGCGKKNAEEQQASPEVSADVTASAAPSASAKPAGKGKTQTDKTQTSASPEVIEPEEGEEAGDNVVSFEELFGDSGQSQSGENGGQSGSSSSGSSGSSDSSASSPTPAPTEKTKTESESQNPGDNGVDFNDLDGDKGKEGNSWSPSV